MYYDKLIERCASRFEVRLPQIELEKKSMAFLLGVFLVAVSQLKAECRRSLDQLSNCTALFLLRLLPHYCEFT